MTTLLIQQVFIMFLLSGIGYVCFRTKKITMEGCRTISNILIYLSLPCVIINSFLCGGIHCLCKSYEVETVIISTLLSILTLPLIVQLAELIHFI